MPEIPSLFFWAQTCPAICLVIWHIFFGHTYDYCCFAAYCMCRFSLLLYFYANPSGIHPGCPKGWNIFEGKCYYFSSGATHNWTTSRDTCVTFGGHLVIINSTEEKVWSLKNSHWPTNLFKLIISYSTVCFGEDIQFDDIWLDYVYKYNKHSKHTTV